jgi:predicted Zn-dependent peptidase
MPNIHKLNNGLTVITDYIDTVETVSVGMWNKVGARNEQEKVNGVAHLLEHMAFKGTANRTALDIAKEVEMVGGAVNAYTSREVTAYYMKVLKEDIGLSIDIISDILQNSTFDAKELDRERGVILQEIGMYLDTPDDVVFDKWQEVAYPDQPMGRSILGKSEIIKSISRDQVEGFMKSFYRPDRMVFSVSGNFQEDLVLDLVEKHFNNLPNGQDDHSPKASYKGGEFRQEKELEQVNIILGFEGVDFYSDLYYSTAVYSTVLGSGMSSRLFQEIREKRGLVYSVSSYTSSFSDSGIFGVYAGTGQKEVKELIPVLCDQLNISAKNFIPEELQRAKAQFKASLLMGQESTSRRCRSNASKYLMHNKIISHDEIISKIDAVQLEDLERARLNILKSNITLSSIGPVQDLESLDSIKARFN